MTNLKRKKRLEKIKSSGELHCRLFSGEGLFRVDCFFFFFFFFCSDIKKKKMRSVEPMTRSEKQPYIPVMHEVFTDRFIFRLNFLRMRLPQEPYD